MRLRFASERAERNLVVHLSSRNGAQSAQKGSQFIVKLSLFHVDAFTDKVFSGNPAAICPLDQWLDERTMLAIAAENNLSETAFCVREGAEYRLRWFTPKSEVQLCGHATLASAFVVFNILEPGTRSVQFRT